MRNDQGRFLKGHKSSPETLAKISASLIKRHERVRELYKAEPETKRCSRCHKMKKLPDDFSFHKKKLKSGITSITPRPECKKCKSLLSAKWREERRVAGKLSEDIKRWNGNRDAENQRKYWREYKTIQRRKRGVEIRGPWKKYRESSLSDRLETKPFSKWLQEMRYRYEISNVEIAYLAGVSEKRIRNIINCTESQITSDLVEKIAHSLHPGTHLGDIYPDLYL